MYEQSIPATAYVFIGIASLVVTYSHIMQSSDDENEQYNNTPDKQIIDTPNESSEPTIPSPTAPPLSNSINNNTPEQITVPVVEAVPIDNLSETNQLQNKGGKRKKKMQKTKSIQLVKRQHKKNKTKKH